MARNSPQHSTDVGRGGAPATRALTLWWLRPGTRTLRNLFQRTIVIPVTRAFACPLRIGGLGNLSGLTNVSGTYLITLSISNITDAAGNSLVASAIDAFAVTGKPAKHSKQHQ